MPMDGHIEQRGIFRPRGAASRSSWRHRLMHKETQMASAKRKQSSNSKSRKNEEGMLEDPSPADAGMTEAWEAKKEGEMSETTGTTETTEIGGLDADASLPYEEDGLDAGYMSGIWDTEDGEAGSPKADPDGIMSRQYEIMNAYSARDFIRKAWIEVAAECPPLAVFDTDFHTVQRKTHCILQDRCSARISCRADKANAGHGRMEPCSGSGVCESVISFEVRGDGKLDYSAFSREYEAYIKCSKAAAKGSAKSGRAVGGTGGAEGNIGGSAGKNVPGGKSAGNPCGIARELEGPDRRPFSLTQEDVSDIRRRHEQELARGVVNRPGDGAGDGYADLPAESMELLHESRSVAFATEYEACLVYDGHRIAKQAFPFGDMQICGDTVPADSKWIKGEKALKSKIAKLRNGICETEKSMAGSNASLEKRKQEIREEYKEKQDEMQIKAANRFFRMYSQIVRSTFRSAHIPFVVSAVISLISMCLSIYMAATYSFETYTAMRLVIVSVGFGVALAVAGGAFLAYFCIDKREYAEFELRDKEIWADHKAVEEQLSDEMDALIADEDSKAKASNAAWGNELKESRRRLAQLEAKAAKGGYAPQAGKVILALNAKLSALQMEQATESEEEYITNKIKSMAGKMMEGKI